MSAFAVNFSFAFYILSLLSYGAGYLFKKRFPQWIGFALMFWVFIVQTIYLGWRWTQGKYAPMSNMYESLVLFVWLVSLLYFLFFAKIRTQERRFPLLGLGFWVSLLSLVLLGFASLNDRSIQSLMPALQSNWLLFHVTATMVGYASFAVSFLGAGVYLVCFRKRPEEEKALAFEGLLERSVVLGFLFLTIGILLGSVWANTAWGSYWSWDPKETWSLITWFFYAVALHLRKTRNWRNEKFAWLTAAG
ncbi:MAG: c-type cytochrome biogenesis protein CcsB, partial [Elusimicrobia bacterium]|nr:c-type cytochrome biogenesis protein CcsB [Elusimicrobiota bacterium]